MFLLLMFIESFLVGLYFSLMAVLTHTAISYFSDLNYNNLNNDVIIKNIDETDDVYKNVIGFLERHNITKDSKIMVSVSGDLSSMSLLSILNSWTNKSDNIVVIYFNDNKRISNIRSGALSHLCLVHNFIYFDYTLPETSDILDINVNYFNKQFFLNGYTELSEKIKSDIVLQAQNMQNTSSTILSKIFNGDSLLDYNDEYEKVDNITIYHPFYNIHFDKIKNVAYNFDVPYFDLLQNSHKRKKAIYEFTQCLDSFYPDWHSNLYKFYRMNVGYERVLQYKYDQVTEKCCDVTKFKYGLIINTPNKYLPFNYWKSFFNNHTELNFDDNIIAKLYFILNTSDSEISGSFDNDFYYYYNNNSLTIYNLTEINNYLNTAELADYQEVNDDSIPYLVSCNKEGTFENLLDGKDIEYVSTTDNVNCFLRSKMPIFIYNNLVFKKFDITNKQNYNDNENYELLIHIKNKK